MTQQLKKEAKQEIIEQLKEIDASKFKDACHCTCLGYAISILTNDEKYHPKDYKCKQLTN